MTESTMFGFPRSEKGKPVAGAVESSISMKWMWGGIALVFAILLAARIYQQMFAWTKGLDAYSTDFQTYWMNFLFAEWAVEGVAAALVWGYLWRTRDRHLDKLEPAEELRRYFRGVMWVVVYTFGLYMSASFFGEQDAAWHQTVIRDTHFTPSHIVLFYLTFPLYIIVGVGMMIYVRTRIPLFANRWSLPLMIAVFAPLMILPNVGFNEWGHSFWIMEERFAAPLHMGFVVLGWLAAMSFFSVVLQATPRFYELTRKIVFRA